ncbi:hypothetical protein B0T19DRAFT_37898 [Cercophora scortea]|uniref:Secreted protein n=1 Tax=Cercophora scortea TaxID=314031 RepID=A0AAE0J4F6_9PEZI|nr:hypothetical protein B0T19DRAFT_37898 [Cercophora scortea]
MSSGFSLVNMFSLLLVRYFTAFVTRYSPGIRFAGVSNTMNRWRRRRNRPQIQYQIAPDLADGCFKGHHKPRSRNGQNGAVGVGKGCLNGTA